MTRPKGYIEGWNPTPATRATLAQVQGVLVTYRAQLPLTVRQIFYRLVAQHDYPKTEQAYRNLCSLLTKARRARVVGFDDIRDDGGVAYAPVTYEDGAEWLAQLPHWAAGFRLDLQAPQACHLVVLCEAAGMAPMLAAVANRYGIAVRSSGGYDSVTVKHHLARELSAVGKPVEILHFGDYDASGVDLYLGLAEDLQLLAAPYGGDIHITRVAVTPEQRDAWDLPTAPPKATDQRGRFSDTATCQCEAIEPDRLQLLLEAAICDRINLGLHDIQVALQRQIRAELVARVT